MKKKALVALSSLICLVLILAALPFMSACAKPAPEKIVLKAVTAWGTDTKMIEVGFDYWKAIVDEKVNKQYPGQLEIKLIGGPEAIATMDQGAALKKGVVDVLLTTTSYIESMVPEAAAGKYSALTPWEDRDIGAHDFWNRIFQEKMNCIYLGRHGRPANFHIFLNKEVTKPDLTGITLRTPPGVFSDIVKALGGAPVMMPPGDLYTALQRGVVEGYLTPYIAPPDFGWPEVTKYVVVPGFFTGPHLLLVNLDAWNKLPEHLQAVLMDASKETEHYAWTFWQTFQEEVRQEYVKVGLESIEFSAADAQRLIDIAYEVAWEDCEKKFPEIVPELKKLMTK